MKVTMLVNWYSSYVDTDSTVASTSSHWLDLVVENRCAHEAIEVSGLVIH